MHSFSQGSVATSTHLSQDVPGQLRPVTLGSVTTSTGLSQNVPGLGLIRISQFSLGPYLWCYLPQGVWDVPGTLSVVLPPTRCLGRPWDPISGATSHKVSGTSLGPFPQGVWDVPGTLSLVLPPTRCLGRPWDPICGATSHKVSRTSLGLYLWCYLPQGV